MARSNTPCGLFLRYKNKALHRLTVPPFHHAGAGFKFCCYARKLLLRRPERGLALLRLGRFCRPVLGPEGCAFLLRLAGLGMPLAGVIGLLLLLLYGRGWLPVRLVLRPTPGNDRGGR